MHGSHSLEFCNELQNIPAPSKQRLVLFLVIWHGITCLCLILLLHWVGKYHNMTSSRSSGQVHRLVLKAHTGTATLKTQVKRVHPSYSFNVKFEYTSRTFSWPLLSKSNQILKFLFPTSLFLVIVSWWECVSHKPKPKFCLTQSFKYRT